MKVDALVKEFAPHVQCASRPLMGAHNSVLVPLTETYLAADRETIARHLAGEAFRAALRAQPTGAGQGAKAEAQEQDSKGWAGKRTVLFSPPCAKTPSGKLRWEKQCRGLVWREAGKA